MIRAKLLGGGIFGLAVMFAIVLGWGLRVDHLRAGYKEALDGVAKTVATLTGKKVVAYPMLSAEIASIDMEARAAEGERDAAVAALKTQSATIRSYEDETRRLRALSDGRAALAERLMADRNRWIVKAQEASSRVERLTAEQELKECDDALDALYAAGF